LLSIGGAEKLELREVLSATHHCMFIKTTVCHAALPYIWFTVHSHTRALTQGAQGVYIENVTERGVSSTAQVQDLMLKVMLRLSGSYALCFNVGCCLNVPSCLWVFVRSLRFSYNFCEFHSIPVFLLQEAYPNRQVRGTSMNAHSSRSHWYHITSYHFTNATNNA
jgi:hypothetical protein